MKSRTLVALSSALTLVLLGGCATPNSGEPSSGGSQGGGGAPAPTNAPAPEPDPIPVPSPTSSSSSSGSSGSAQTSEERRDAIDRRLDDSLGTFDDTIRKEQERVAKERDAREATGTADASSDSDEANPESKEGEGEPGSGEPEKAVVASTDGKSGDSTARPGDLKSDKDREGASSGAASGSGATAQNIPDGSDDDIVARRLRKAAEQETDPELKEKLWKEYIEYKKNAGSS